MPYYKGTLDQLEGHPDKRALERVGACILGLRRQFKKQNVPDRNLTATLLLATWNIREFGRNAKCGPRTAESLLYIAEIVSHFDIVAVQEVHQNLKDLKHVLELLGDSWNYLVTDVTEGRSGNEERIAFLYDTRKVRFDHLAGEVTLPEKKGKPVRQSARSPFICAFQAGWRRFTLCSVHIYYGTKNPNDPRRVAEISSIADLLAARNERRLNSPDGEPDTVILLGDFNIFNQSGDETSKALEKAGFIVPKEITKIPGGRNLARDKYYDQIAFLHPKGNLRSTKRAGVFDFRQMIYRDGDHERYATEMALCDAERYSNAKSPAAYYKNWLTFQISDHLPLWLELQIDFSEGYLARRAGFATRRGDKRGVKTEEPKTSVVTK
jgi:endonuclease/exonuclease/phosphatase family metal-dependent hydrolase